MTVEHRVLADLAEFARLELEAGDVEPWAAVIGHLHRSGHLDTEQALWAVKLYNAYDDISSAWRVAADWPTPAAWALAGPERRKAAAYFISRERRNLFGGRLVRHLDSYVEGLDGRDQLEWLREALTGTDPYANFLTLMPYLRRTWGTGRQSAFEWAEFVAKVLSLPVETPDACLWESSGPRESLQRLYGNPAPTEQWLNERAEECRTWLASQGAPLSWWDFETVICDFNVMRKGRYYPGAHIAMIREEIESLPNPARAQLREALAAAVPAPWIDTPPGRDKQLGRAYAATGRIHTPFSGGPA